MPDANPPAILLFLPSETGLEYGGWHIVRLGSTRLVQLTKNYCNFDYDPNDDDDDDDCDDNL